MTGLYIIGGLLLFSAFTVWLAVKMAGRAAVEQERKEAARDALEEVRKANEALASVGGMSADDRRRELQRWSRD